MISDRLRRRDRLTGHLFEARLLAIKIDRTFVPSRRSLPAAEQRAVDADHPALRMRQLDNPAVPQRQPVRADEPEAAGMQVIGVQGPGLRMGHVAEQPQRRPHPIAMPRLGSAFDPLMLSRLQRRKNQLHFPRQPVRRRGLCDLRVLLNSNHCFSE
jgi:hypothetical protein